MLKTKYEFLKKMYPNTVIVFLVNKKYCVLYEDLNILKCFNTHGLFNNLNNFHVNYIVLEDLEILNKKFFKDNNYKNLLIKGSIINRIKSL